MPEQRLEAEVAVVGAGPAGIIVALELAGAGHEVLLIESGGERFDPRRQELGETVGADPHHDAMSLATRRQVGGASNLWGGRCVPFDPVDFEPREVVGGARWPLGYEDVAGGHLPQNLTRPINSTLWSIPSAAPRRSASVWRRSCCS